jgi:hypothetical protein
MLDADAKLEEKSELISTITCSTALRRKITQDMRH